ncbi:MAG TPA: RNA 2',3'-cyclic phosphodiesterase [Gemmatimonadaceae bacterium]|nr:RNA 2',3'-cyclic phosphodiesterase [Gemmatimonadaceae bacterium]
MHGASVRLFVAINLPADVRRAIVDVTAPMRQAAPRLSWVTEERLHLTMEFLGDQPEEAVPPLGAALAREAARHAPVTLALRGLGAFPNLRAPRIVWLGVAADPKLELLQHDLSSACGELGYERDARAFRPHITLGRARTPLRAEAARALATAARAVTWSATVEARSVDIMESRLLPSGARYGVVAAIPLGGA